ncbi:IS200/IS605 family accessory protein TnpB-related protein [Okeania sp. KiyG1]|uniref:IS200/IS605 family accessory protein TnpB-related protein n=1 Tax=Okeania sp. KiyG1 TaxID=2720165 RepID=UPI001920B20B|nr:IS200/IS605 family accessory protein TnpB-related protein [Okeania sp. KiyG1]
MINGRPLKSINQYYNKVKSFLQSKLRENQSSKRLKNFVIKENLKSKIILRIASRLIINTLINQKIGTLIIGHNQEWKQKINLGKRNNQNFVSVPYNRLIEMLCYKAKMVGINVILTEESYMSKASFIDNYLIPVYNKSEKNQVTFSGKRIKRGLYSTASKRLINEVC